MSGKNSNNFETEGTGEKWFFAFERGLWETLKTYGKFLFYFDGFSKGFSGKLLDF